MRLMCTGINTLSLLAIVLGRTVQLDGQDPNDILSKMREAREDQRSRLCQYSGLRHYTLRNKHLNPSAEMEVRLAFEKGQGKHFEILSMRASGIARRSLKDLLKHERQASKDAPGNSAIDESNYRFNFLGTEKCLGLSCYKFRLIPRRKTKLLVDGTAWISIDDNMVVRIVGRLAKSPSFWVRRPEVDQQFEKVKGFWLPSYTHSKTHVRFVGDTDLTIQYSGYEVQSCSSSAAGHAEYHAKRTRMAKPPQLNTRKVARRVSASEPGKEIV